MYNTEKIDQGKEFTGTSQKYLGRHTLNDQNWFVGQQIVQVLARNANWNSLLLNHYQRLCWSERNNIEEDILECITVHLRSSKITHP